MSRAIGDIETIFGNPFKCTLPIGQARLKKYTQDVGAFLEEWVVEYTDHEGHFYNALLKKHDIVTTRDLQELDKAEEEHGNTN